MLVCIQQVGEVIAKSDYVLVAAALTTETKGMVGAAELARVSVLATVGVLSVEANTQAKNEFSAWNYC